MFSSFPSPIVGHNDLWLLIEDYCILHTMKRKAVTILLAAVLCAVFAATVFASDTKPVKAMIYPLESSLYEDMDMLYALCGMARQRVFTSSYILSGAFCE